MMVADDRAVARGTTGYCGPESTARPPSSTAWMRRYCDVLQRIRVQQHEVGALADGDRGRSRRRCRDNGPAPVSRRAGPSAGLRPASTSSASSRCSAWPGYTSGEGASVRAISGTPARCRVATSARVAFHFCIDRSDGAAGSVARMPFQRARTSAGTCRNCGSGCRAAGRVGLRRAPAPWSAPCTWPVVANARDAIAQGLVVCLQHRQVLRDAQVHERFAFELAPPRSLRTRWACRPR